ncbi:MAG: hypothetical protein J7574_19665 [Flavobacterium sp.]|uniref:hypothetical protein n=1 Tax=Flavobacterium sp. TaxID=239 RepID=UPI001B070F88|nr:hypothetical protein [Flavobacterium sp.]MBO9586388.1 hypothetical protein [Flavobacterium sp.]
MKYVPNLIPEKSQVLKHYFTGRIDQTKKVNPIQNFLSWSGGLIFLLWAVVSLKHPLLTLFLGVIGFLIIPPGHKWIEKKFRFNLTTKIKFSFGLVLFLFSIPLLAHYASIDKKEAHLLKLKIAQEEKQKAELEKEEKNRNDSLSFYLNAISEKADKHKISDAKKLLGRAMFFAKLPLDRDKIEIEKSNISRIVALDLINSGEYRRAIPFLDTLIDNNGNDAGLRVKRAICYSKTGNLKEAVSDSKTAIGLGDKDAEKLYNKINPLKKRIAYYVTRCCDGTTSNSTGRGTCSHHGGVCNWSEPVYEEYRKYE